MADPPPPSYDASTGAAQAPAACSTCALLLSFDANPEVEDSTAPIPQQQTSCCARWVCRRCIEENPRFATYCPFCPSSSRLLPPSYSPLPPPPVAATPTQQQHEEPADEILHFLRPTDTLQSLALLYNVPPAAVRSHNRLWADMLLQGRQVVVIPAHYRGVSFNPRPRDGEDERCAVKRFQARTKCVDTGAAEVYLQVAGGRLEEAVEAWRGDEEWAREQEGEARTWTWKRR